MTYRRQRFEIRKAGDETIFSFPEVERLKKRLRNIQSSREPRAVRIDPDPTPEMKSAAESKRSSRKIKYTRVYLYLQLQQMFNIPEVPSKRLKMRLSHANDKVSLLRDHGANKRDEVEITDVAEFKPTFTITIDQDNTEHVNSFSDNPLRILLYEMDAPDCSELTGVFEEESEEIRAPNEKLVAEGVIDLLPFFTKQRKLSLIDIFLYPKNMTPEDADQRTCKTSWQIYSLLPLIKEIVLSNMVYITFESIYNVPQDIMNMGEDLVAEIYFQSKLPIEGNVLDKQKICDFRSFYIATIASQNRKTRWESLASTKFSSRGTDMSSYTGSSITHPLKILDKLLCSEGLHQHLREVSVHEDEAIVCNTVRRYLLTSELNKILEDVVAFNEQEILIEIHSIEDPDDILLRGVIDLSVFLYPRVNACRFGVALNVATHQISKVSSRYELSKSKKRSPFTASYTSSNFHYKQRRDLVPFAIINICLNTPITEKPMEKRLGSIKLIATCDATPEDPETEGPKRTQDHYKDFDELIREMIDHIIKHDIKVTDDCHSYFCSQLGNLTNKILKLVQFDVNVRVPTKNSIEFTKLMTLVYKELLERIYGIIRNCNENSLKKCSLMTNQVKEKIMELMTHLKYCQEVNDYDTVEVIKRRLERLNEKKLILDFYMMLMDLEYDRLEPVKFYLTRPLKDRYLPGEYITGFIRIYVRYFETQVEEVTYNAAYQYLLGALKEFSNRNPSAMEPYILLFCLYKMKNYEPGISFTRWRFESMFKNEETPDTWIEIPKSRWEIYFTHKLSFDSLKGKNFFKVMQFFYRYGMYAFGEIIFREVAVESKNDIQKYCINNMFRMMQRELMSRTNLRSMPSGDPEVQATLLHMNGHLEYYRGNEMQSMEYYTSIVSNDKLHSRYPFQLGILRYAYCMLHRRYYEKAAKAFKMLIPGVNSFAALVGLGKAYYKLNKYKDAERAFVETTRYKMHIPDVWAYLALINLKGNKIYQALESWKYAKCFPNAVISEEILNELNQIDRKDISLHVDLPRTPGVEDPPSQEIFDTRTSKVSGPLLEPMPLIAATFNEASTSIHSSMKQSAIKESITKTDMVKKDIIKLRRR